MKDTTMQVHDHALLVTEKQVAKQLGLKVCTLRRWRWAGEGPRFLKLGGAVRYDPLDIEAYIAASRRKSTSDAGSQGND